MWIKRMEDFRGALKDVHQELEAMRIKEPERVKVSLAYLFEYPPLSPYQLCTFRVYARVLSHYVLHLFSDSPAII